MQTGTATVESSMETPQTSKNSPAFGPVIPLLGTYPKEPKILIRKNIHPYVHCSIIYNHQDMQAAVHQ